MKINKSFINTVGLIIAVVCGAADSMPTPTIASGVALPNELKDNRSTVPMNCALPGPVDGLSFLLRIIFDPHSQMQYRMEAVRDLGDDLGRGEVDRLLSFLKSRPDSREKNLAGLRALKNNIINALKDQNIRPAGLTATLIDIFHDHSQDFVTRDYAVQHLTTWYERSSEEASDAKNRIQTTLEEALHEDTTIAGTALLGLHQLSANDRTVDSTEIERRAVEMTVSSGTPLSVRITAIQICAERGLTEALPEIEHFSEANGQTALQLSAIAALGRLGNAADEASLQRLTREGDSALNPAITLAVKRLRRIVASRKQF